MVYVAVSVLFWDHLELGNLGILKLLNLEIWEFAARQKTELQEATRELRELKKSGLEKGWKKKKIN